MNNVLVLGKFLIIKNVPNFMDFDMYIFENDTDVNKNVQKTASSNYNTSIVSFVVIKKK